MKPSTYDIATNAPSVVSPQMLADYNAFFDLPMGTSTNIAGGVLVKKDIPHIASGEAAIFLDQDGNTTFVLKNSSLYDLALVNPYLYEAWKKNYGFDPKAIEAENV